MNRIFDCKRYMPIPWYTSYTGHAQPLDREPHSAPEEIECGPLDLILKVIQFTGT